MSIIAALQKVLTRRPHLKRVWIAYSGGVDSHVLLHAIKALHAYFPHIELAAIHIHHGLSVQADQWVEHCRSVCQSLDVPCEVVRVHIPSVSDESLEALARRERYQVFSRLIQERDAVLTAHHLEDQAETCLLQFLRGSGPKGLASMPSEISFAKGWLIRPFLSLSRQAILYYANQHGLLWIEDESNRDTCFTRNFLRYKVMPFLKERWPNVDETIMRVASHSAEADQLLQELAKIDLDALQGSKPNTLSIKGLCQLSYPRQKNVLRTWLAQQGFLLPSSIKLESLIKEVLYAKEDAMPLLTWRGAECRRYRDDLYALTPLSAHDVRWVGKWSGREALLLPSNLGVLTSQIVQGRGIALSKCIRPFTVKFRIGGESCRLRVCSGSRQLKKLYQEWGVPTWVRDRIPLIFSDDQLVSVVGYAISEEYIASCEEEGLEISWHNKR